MERNYRVSTNGISVKFVDREEAVSYAKQLNSEDSWRRIKVYDTRFNNVIYQN